MTLASSQPSSSSKTAATSSLETPAPAVRSTPLNGVVPGVPGQRAFPVGGLRNADPFLMLDHIGPGELDPGHEIDGAAHPHRGFETVSIFLEGSTEHVDSLGHRETIAAGDAQLMNAGRGILHGGVMRPDPETGRFHEFQLWVNVPSSNKMDEPYIQRAPAGVIPELNSEGLRARVIAGEFADLRGPIETKVPTTIMHVQADANTVLPALRVPEDHRVYLYVISGEFRSRRAQAAAGETLVLTAKQAQALGSSEAKLEYLLLAGQPIGETVVFGGPFVMNTQAEIEQAYKDYESGAFGRVPG